MSKLFYWVNVTIPGEHGFLTYQKLRMNWSKLDRIVLRTVMIMALICLIYLVCVIVAWCNTIIMQP